MSTDLFRRYIDIVEQAAPPIPGMPTGRKEMPEPRPATQDEINGLAAMSKSHTLAPDLMVYWWQDPKLKEFPKEMWQDLEKNLKAIREKHQKWPAIPRADNKPAAPARPQSTLSRVRAGLDTRGGMTEAEKQDELKRIREMAGVEEAVGPTASGFGSITVPIQSQDDDAKMDSHYQQHIEQYGLFSDPDFVAWFETAKQSLLANPSDENAKRWSADQVRRFGSKLIGQTSRYRAGYKDAYYTPAIKGILDQDVQLMYLVKQRQEQNFEEFMENIDQWRANWHKMTDKYKEKLSKMTGQEIEELEQIIAAGRTEQNNVNESKSLAAYIAESERAFGQPVAGDYFAINIREETLFETYVCDETPDGIVIYADDVGMQLLEDYGYLGEPLQEGHDFAIDSDEDSVDVVDRGEYDQEGDMAKDDLATIVRAARRLTGMLDDDENMPEWVQSKINKAADYVDTAADYIESNKERAQDMAEGYEDDEEEMCHMCSGTGEGRHESESCSHCHGTGYEPAEHDDDDFDIPEKEPRDYGDDESYYEKFIRSNNFEAKYQGREVPLGKPMKGDVKKSKVYVRGPKGNVVKVNFGQKGMKIKKNIPGRRKNFRARHNCDNPGPRWKARYWSCRAW